MYFPDLSSYQYVRPEPNTLNIGWLAKDHNFPQGKVPDVFTARLNIFMRAIVHDNCFGAHACEFCDDYFSSGEIRVFGLNKVAYAAPTMIRHYILKHDYLPPEEFVEAVIHGPDPKSEEYRILAKGYIWFEDDI